MKPWFERYPAHYEAELQAFKDLGISIKEDEQLKEKHGILRITLTIGNANPNFDLTTEGKDCTLVVVYPDSYPWFRPQVYAYELSLARHQHLLGKNLCLLPRATRHWYTQQTVAHLLQAQLAEVLQKGVVEDLDVVREDPSEQAEPVSDYFHHHASVLFDPGAIPVVPPMQAFEVMGSMLVGLPEDAPFFSRMAVKEISVKGLPHKHSLPPAIQRQFPRSLKGVLVKTAVHPPVAAGPVILDWLRKGLGAQAGLLKANQKQSFREGTYTDIVALTFPEEVQRGVMGMGWIFLVQGLALPLDKYNRPVLGKSLKPVAYVAKPAYISLDAQKDRVPRLAPLGSKTVAVIGLGALGGNAALELARSGVKEIRILDFDTIEPPTTVRWPLGLTAAGLPKTGVIQRFIQENYPHTSVRAERWRLGDLRLAGDMEEVMEPRSEMEILEGLLSGVDLIIDATAEEGVNNYLSRQAYSRDLPYVGMYATPGAWGGVVMRYLPGQTGCWACMKQWQSENPKDLVPPGDAQGEIQPPGCGDLTFTGAGFDLQNVSLAGVRLAVSTLCRGAEGGYPDVDWDWALLRMVDEQGRATIPQWTAQPLVPHLKCPYHGSH